MDPIVPDLQISWILCKSMYQITNSASRGWLLNTSGSQTWSGGTTGEKRKNDRKKLVLEKRIRKSNKKMELNRSENAKELKEVLAGLREDLKNLKK